MSKKNKRNNFNYKKTVSKVTQNKKPKWNKAHTIVLILLISLISTSILTIVNTVSIYNNHYNVKADSYSASLYANEIELGNPINPFDYDTTNLLPYPYFSASNDFVTVSEDGRLIINGNVNDYSPNFFFLASYSGFFRIGTYNFSLSGIPQEYYNSFQLFITQRINGTSSVLLGVSGNQSYDSTTQSINGSFSVNEINLSAEFSIYLNFVTNGNTYNNLVLSPMLNNGAVRQPYQPSFNLIYEKGQISQDTLNGLMTSGVFYNATANVMMYDRDTDNVITNSGVPYFSYSNISMNNLVNQYLDVKLANGMSRYVPMLFGFTFYKPFNYSLYPVYYYGSNDISSFNNVHIIANFVDYSGNVYLASSNENDNYDLILRYDFDESLNSARIILERKPYSTMLNNVFDSLSIISFNWDFTLDYTVDYSNYDFNFGLSTLSTGYTVGYNQGLEEGEKIGYEKGLKYNQEAIKNKAYTDGYNAGSRDSNEYTFLSLLSAVVDAPVNTFTSLFDFSILGFNVKEFVLFLFTICFVVVILRFIF